MREGWIYLNNEKVFLQNLPEHEGYVWHTWSAEDGWNPLNRNDLIQSIIEDLEGTCKTLMDSCEDHNINEDELEFHEFDEIEQNIFLCDYCGWWYSMGEEHETDDGTICDNCYEYGVN